MIDPHKLSVLLVDSDKEIRRAVRQSLLPDGFLVLDIPTTREAAVTAQDILFDLLIIDPFQPFTMDLIARLGRSNPGQRVLFLSDYAPETVVNFGLCPRGSEIMRKPFTAEELNRRVRACLEAAPLWKDVLSIAQGHSRGHGEVAPRDDEGALDTSRFA